MNRRTLLHGRALCVATFGMALSTVSTGFLSGSGQDVARTAADARPLKAGAIAPNAALTSIEGKATELRDILGARATALIFYRGGWCPFCNRHLADLATVEADLRKMGIQIVAVSPDTPEELKKTLGKQKLAYQVFSDSKAQSIKSFGVAFRLDDETFSMYKSRFNIDLERSSGEQHHILPVPSVFLIDRFGKIVFAYSNPDYKVRMKPADILQAAKTALK